jgi:hypothetical protein
MRQELTAGILPIRLGSHCDASKVRRAVVDTLFDFARLEPKRRFMIRGKLSLDRPDRQREAGKTFST